MKPMALNLSKMKKIASDGKTSTFMHPSGHKMVIAHEPLSALQKKQIEQIPIKMADGGDVPDDQSPASPALGGAAEDTVAEHGVQPEASSPTFSSGQPSPPDAPDQQPQQQDQASQAPAPQNAPMSGADIVGAYNQGQNAISEQQKVSSDLSAEHAKIQADDLKARNDLMSAFQNNQKAFTEQQGHLLDDYKNNHIDPNHYQENMGTGQKVATAIGLLFGGFKQGFAGGANPAQDWLNGQIDRDIDAQKTKMGQQKTLLEANQNLFHDQMLAQNQTRVNLNDIYDHQIQEAASKLGTPQAKAAADAAHSDFALKNAQLLQQNAIRATVLQSIKNGGSGLSAIDLAHAGMIPEQDAIKEQSSIDSQKKAISSAHDIFSQYSNEQTAGNLLNPQSYKRANDLNAQLTNLIMESDASKRLTPESATIEVKPFWVNTGDTKATINSKLQGISNLIRQHAAPTPYMSQYAPKSVPQYGGSTGQVTNSMEGKTASDAKGNQLIMRNGRWVPLGK